MDAAGVVRESCFAYSADSRGGLWVASADVDGNGPADVVTGAGAGGDPVVRAFAGHGAMFAEWAAYAADFRGGVRVAADVTGDAFADVITGPGDGDGPHVTMWDGFTFAPSQSIYAVTGDGAAGFAAAAGSVPPPVFEGGALVVPGDPGTPAQIDARYLRRFTNTASEVGLFRVDDAAGTVGDPGGLSAADSFTITVRTDKTPFPADLSGWTLAERGGTAGTRGTVGVTDGTAVLREGDSFTTTLSRSFVVPGGVSSLSFAAPRFGFDTPDPTVFVNDAFEAALLDPAGNPLVATIGSGRDAFFNVTETQAVARGAGVIEKDGRVSLDLSGVPAGTVATLVFRLVGDDADRTGNAGVDWFALPTDMTADAAAGRAFRYGVEGLGSGGFDTTGAAEIRGAATNPAGDKVWLIDAQAREVSVFSSAASGPCGTTSVVWAGRRAPAPPATRSRSTPRTPAPLTSLPTATRSGRPTPRRPRCSCTTCPGCYSAGGSSTATTWPERDCPQPGRRHRPPGGRSCGAERLPVPHRRERPRGPTRCRGHVPAQPVRHRPRGDRRPASRPSACTSGTPTTCGRARSSRPRGSARRTPCSWGASPAGSTPARS